MKTTKTPPPPTTTTHWFAHSCPTAVRSATVLKIENDSCIKHKLCYVYDRRKKKKKRIAHMKKKRRRRNGRRQLCNKYDG